MSPTPENAIEILAALGLGEDRDWEFKSARGGIPGSLWETYSAMANTDGGVVIVGVSEAGPDRRVVDGLPDAIRAQPVFDWETPQVERGDSLDKEGEGHEIGGRDSLDRGGGTSQIDDARSTPELTTKPHQSSNLQTEDPEIRKSRIANEARINRRMPVNRLSELVIEACQDKFLSVGELAAILDRNPEYLRNRVIRSLTERRLLELKFPDNRHRPDQAYRKARST